MNIDIPTVEGETTPETDPLLQFDEDINEEKVTEKLKHWNSEWDQFSANLYPTMKMYWNLYRNMETNVEGVSTKMPEVFVQVETSIPYLLGSIFSHSAVIDAAPKFSDPTGEQSYKVKSYINKLIKDVCNGRKKTELLIKNMLIYGWAVGKVIWNTEPDHDIDMLTKEVIPINSAHPDFYNVDPFAFAYDPHYDGQKIDELEWIRERIYISKNELRRMRDNGECADFNDEEMDAVGDKNKGQEMRKKSSDHEKNTGRTYYDEFWCVLYKKNEEGKLESAKYRIWLLGNNKIIKFERNLYERKPYFIVRSYSNPNEFLGVGISEVMGSIAKQVSLVHYQSGKMVKKVGQNLTFVDPSAGISPQNLKRIEQGVLFVNNLNGIRSEQSTDPSNIQVLVKYQEYLDNKIQQITGIGPTLQGEVQGDTATQASIANQNASNRLAGQLIHLQEDFIKPLSEIFFMMNKQLLQYPVKFFDTNNNLIKLIPEDFNGNYDWMPVGTISQSNKALQLQQNQELLGGLLQMAQASQMTKNPFTVNIPYFISQHLAPYANIPDIQNIITQLTPEEVPQAGPPSPTNTPTPSASPEAANIPPITNPSPDEMQPIEPAANLGRR